MINRKLLILVTLSSLMNGFLIKPVLAEGEAVTNEPIKEGKVIVGTFGTNNEIVPIGEAGTFVNGEINVSISENIPEGTVLVVMVQDTEGQAAPQITLVTDIKKPIIVDAIETAKFHLLEAFGSKIEDFKLSDLDVKQVAAFSEALDPVFKDVPLDDNTTDTAALFAQAASLQPGLLVAATDSFNAAKKEIVTVVLMADEAITASYDPLEGGPELPDEPEASVTAGLFSKEDMSKMPFQLSAICVTCPPGEAFIGGVPLGSYTLPALKTNRNALFGAGVFMPQGIEIVEGTELPSDVVLAPGTIIGANWKPKAGTKFPPGMITPEGGFDPSEFGAEQLTEFNAPNGYKTSPGFGLADNKGGFMMPAWLKLPLGAELPEGLAMAFPSQVAVSPQLGFGISSLNLQPPVFGEGFKGPLGFNPATEGLAPPPNFMPPPGPRPANFAGATNFFDPFAGKFTVPTDGSTGPFVPPLQFAAMQEKGMDPNSVAGMFAPVPPLPGGEGKGGSRPSDGSEGLPGFDSGGTNPPPPPSSGGTPPPPAGGTNPPPPSGGTPPPPPADRPANAPPPSGGTPPPPPPSGSEGPKDPPPQRIKARSIKAKLASYESGSNKAGVRSTLTVTTSSKAKRLTASKGVYLIGKAKVANTKAQVTMIVDPSITSDSVNVSLGLTNNEVNTQVVDLENDAVQLITQLDGKVIEMTTANSGVEDIAASSVTGYLLAPGTSAYKMQTAIALKGTVVAGDSGDIVQFTLPAKTPASGVYTVTFQDGDDVYYGKLTIGTLRARTISGKALAPNGQL